MDEAITIIKSEAKVLAKEIITNGSASVLAYSIPKLGTSGKKLKHKMTG